MTGAAVFELRAVTRTYEGNGPPVRALRSTDLVIRPGTYTAIVGPSGSGKSTLLNVLGLLDQPTEGVVLVDGIDVARLRRAQRGALRAARIGFVFQAFHLLPGRTVADNAALGLLYAGVPRRERLRLTASILDDVGLGHRMYADAATLSGGERQRVAIARAIASGATVILCDEPTGNLDRATGDSILGLLAGLHRAGTTIVAVTHDDRVAAEAQDVVTVADGLVSRPAALV